MVKLKEYISESNAIEDVHTQSSIDDSLDAWNYLEKQDSLPHDVVQRAHEHILKNRQPEIAGDYRDIQVSIGERTPPPPVVVQSEMEKLLHWEPVDPLEAIEWHIAFEHIHPFADGNGRIGRLIYLWHCKGMDAEPILWRAEDRDGYYELFDTSIHLDARTSLSVGSDSVDGG